MATGEIPCLFGEPCNLQCSNITSNPNSGGLAVTLISSLIATVLDAGQQLGDTSIYPADINTPLDQYDFIVVGAGSSGSVVANRLSEIPEWNVLLIEAGGDPTITSEVPSLLLFMQGGATDWQYMTEPQEDACLGMKERRCIWPRGKVLGGCSVINGMLYVRGNKRDYDTWEELGNIGWSYDDVLPYFKKSEDFKSVKLSESRDAEYSAYYHGTNGYLSLEQFQFKSPVVEGLVAGYEDLGYMMRDINGAKQTGITFQHATVINGTRDNTAKAFLSPVKDRQNLHVLKNTLVTKLLIDPDNKTVYGVEYLRNNESHTVRASKEVIVSGGTVNSPQLLMLSGIGHADHLEEMGIPVIQNLSVGDNLQDHLQLLYPTFMFNKSHPVGVDPIEVADDTLQYLLHRSGRFASLDQLQLQAFVNTKYENETLDYPDLQYHHYRFPFNIPNTTRLVSDGTGYTDDVYKVVFEHPNSKAEIFIPLSILLRPKSRGFIRLRSTNPLEHPIIDPRYLSDPQDVNILVEGIKIFAKLAKTRELAEEFEFEMNEEKLPGCDAEFGTDEYWECAVRMTATTIYHPVGTCKMGPSSDPDAVVDPRLRVQGVKGLRVIDGSVMPNIVSGNTNAACIMIGEKGADLVKEDWGVLG